MRPWPNPLPEPTDCLLAKQIGADAVISAIAGCDIGSVVARLSASGHYAHRTFMRAFIVTLVSCAVFSASALFAGSINTNNIAAGFYRTVVSTNTGQYAVVDSHKEVVTLYDKTDHVIWSTNVVAGLRSAPVLGQRQISGMQVYQGDLWVNVGRGYGILVIKTGALMGFAQD